ncbi:unnamed protein product [Somion occarium]|uniref:Cytochrome P450 n=1 Tax=Somion occarium TaxID=3059160 RepID=A0ABP1CM33_9APHY
MGFTLLNIAICSAALLAFHWLYSRRGSRHSSPPSLPGLPIIGNLRDLQAHENWLTFFRWGKANNSDLIHLRSFGTDFVVVNTLEIATDLFDKRSSIYNDRPRYTMLNELVGFEWLIGLIPYGDLWKDTRRSFHREIGSVGLKRFTNIELAASRQLLRRLRSSPEAYMKHIRHMAGRIIMRIAYGIEIKEENDVYIDIAEEAMQAFSACTNAGSFLVDLMPILKYLPEWFPGSDFKQLAKAWRVPVTAMLDRPFEFVKKHTELDDIPTCAAVTLREDMKKRDVDPAYADYVAKATLASMYAGGADTTVSTLSSFVLAMTLYPDVQVRAQEEIDRVIGAGRLPDFSDRNSLPYVEAVVRESLRWHPVLPIASPHRLLQDDEYNGYFLPKGTFVIGNIWAMLHDPMVYPDPGAFKPERFLKDGVIDPTVRDPTVACFGFGRRICPGRLLAKESVWITVASLLATYKFSKAIGPDGKPITPKEDYIPGTISYPKPFACDMRPRSAEYEALIMASSNED